MDYKDEKYLQLLSQTYPTRQSVVREIINLNAVLSLPKGTEHFMSDLHGEFEAFFHILKNCSGVIREKVQAICGETLTPSEIQALCTLIYYPREKMKMMALDGRIDDGWYRENLNYMILIARQLSSKYTRKKVRAAMDPDFAYIMDELLHMQKDEDDNQLHYHQNIIETIISTGSADEFIVAMTWLIKHLAVDHLHIVGDIYDRGPSADKIMDLLMQYHSIDIQWGNHDILWMGAACGSPVCVANVVRNNLRHRNTSILDKGYGISLTRLTLFALKTYDEPDPVKAAAKAISIISYKLEARAIRRNPEFGMDERSMITRVNWETGALTIDGKDYPIDLKQFPTVDPKDPSRLTEEEARVITELTADFKASEHLQHHISFLYDKGSMYRIYNDNLLYHGCVPMDEEGNLYGVRFNGRFYRGRSYLDYADQVARRAFYGDSGSTGIDPFHDLTETESGIGTERKRDLDFMWYLWAGPKSPLCGRVLKTFEREFLTDESTWAEPTDPYYHYYSQERYCNMILREFGLYSSISHIINGHTPVKTGKGELPVRAGGRLYVIDGGFCRDMHKTTGIAGYTLIYNSHGIRLKAHHPFTGIEDALIKNEDIESDAKMVEVEKERVMIRDTDQGREILEMIRDLEALLERYRTGRG